MINFSIIVCTYNRCEYLKETIESIIDAIDKRQDCELLIIDNNSGDQTSAIVKSFNSFLSLKYFLETRQGLSHARNRGMQEAAGDVLVYLDDDIELPSNYFEVCDQIFQNPEIAISGGKVLPYNVNIPDWLPKKYYFLVSVYDMGNEPRFVKYLMGGNFAIRKEIAKNIGTYNSELGRKGNSLAGGEEIDYQNRATELGYQMYYHPRQNILHKINEKLNEAYVLKYAFELGKSERIIDQSLSTNRVKIKLLKSHIAIIAHSLLSGILTKGKSLSYIRIINQYAKGYKK